MHKRCASISLPLLFLAFMTGLAAQENLLLNGDFEAINTCTEYDAECGVEGWFYLKDVKAQMLSNEEGSTMFGLNSFGIYFTWLGYTDFTPVIGAILPCHLQKNKHYTFKGILSARLNPKLKLKPGICLGEKFFVPRRSFSKAMKPDSIVQIEAIPGKDFFSFNYSFIANGEERYLTFGTYIEEDTLGAKKKLIGTQTVSLVLDNFELVPTDANETYCPDYAVNKEKIYNYNYRHKVMDYSLYGKGELDIPFTNNDSSVVTRIKESVNQQPKTDTLKLGDVLFDFNKAALKPTAIQVLENYFTAINYTSIDSIIVEGHTDSVGSEAKNVQLSRERCESVRNWFVTKEFYNKENIQIIPYGKSRPISSNQTSEGRALNRRVELIIFRKVNQ